MTHTLLQLHTALRAQAKGLHACEAATELLIMHASWLHRGDFLNEFVDTGTGLVSGIPMAAINWPEAITALENGRLPCSGGESRMLKIAASLAEGIPVNLRDTLTGLDTTNIDIVASAVLHAGEQK
jgi:hypothetical protein